MIITNGRMEHGFLGSYRIVLKQTWKMVRKVDFLMQDHNFLFSICILHQEHVLENNTKDHILTPLNHFSTIVKKVLDENGT